MLSRLSTKLIHTKVWHKLSASIKHFERLQNRVDSQINVAQRQEVPPVEGRSVDRAEHDNGWQEFIDICTDWLWETDIEHRFSWLSPGANRQTETAPDLSPLLQQRLLDLVILELSPDYWEEVAKAITARQIFRNVLLCLQIEQKLSWMHLSGKPRFSVDGKFQGYRGCAVEIGQPIGNDTVFSAILEGNLRNCGIALFDDQAALVAWNQEFSELHSYLSEQLQVGMNCRQWLIQQKAQNVLTSPGDCVEEWLDSHCNDRLQSEIIHLNGWGWRKCACIKRQDGGFLWLETAMPKLGAESELLNNALTQVPAKDGLAVILIDGDSLSIRDANAAACDLYDCALTDLLESNILDLFAQTDEGVSFIGRALAQGSGYTSWVLHRTKRGAAVAVEMSVSELQLSAASGFCLTMRSIAMLPTENRTALLERLQDFTEIAVDVAWELDSEFRMVYASDRLLSMLDRSAASIVGVDFAQALQPIVSDPSTLQAYQHKMYSRESVAMELPFQLANSAIRVYRMTAKPIFGAENEFQGYRGVGQDITDSFQLSQQLIYQATHDELTGLINRREFEHRLAGARERSKTSGVEHVLCYVDLDQFKIVNDTVGHNAGDQLLRQVAGILSSRVRRHDTVARLGGDEFGLLLDGCGLEDACRIAQSLIDDLKSFRFSWQEHQFEIGASIGMVPINPSSSTVSHLLSLADIACYAAKDGGRNRYHVYQIEDQELVQRHADLRSAASLSQALQDDRFILLAQSIYDLNLGDGDFDEINHSANKTEHVELLLRVTDTEGHILKPGAFIPAAERFGLMATIDRWVINTALTQYESFFGKGAKVKLSINLSALSLTDPGMTDYIKAQIAKSSVPPDRICFEITETAAIRNFSQAKRFVAELRELGCLFSLDDFGSGLSSFSYLREFAVDYLKIDSSFVRHMALDPVNRTLVAAINNVGHAMGMHTIAEGAEDRETVALLRELGVDYVQGFIVAKPRLLYRHSRAPKISQQKLLAI